MQPTDISLMLKFSIGFEIFEKQSSEGHPAGGLVTKDTTEGCMMRVTEPHNEHQPISMHFFLFPFFFFNFLVGVGASFAMIACADFFFFFLVITHFIISYFQILPYFMP